MPERRMNEDYADAMLVNANTVKGALLAWRTGHPHVADWRVESAYTAACRLVALLSYLEKDIDPEGDAARAELLRKRPEMFEESPEEVAQQDREYWNGRD